MSMTALVAVLSRAGSVLIGFIKEYPWQIALACAAYYAWWQYDRAEDWRERSSIEAANHAQTKANYREAQARAAKLARDQREATERRYAELAKEADDANEEADTWRARAGAFADRGGLRGQGGACVAGAAGKPGAASESDAATSDHGSGYVTVSRTDFDVLTENTHRLLRAHDWGERLIDEGLAESATKPIAQD